MDARWKFGEHERSERVAATTAAATTTAEASTNVHRIEKNRTGKSLKTGRRFVSQHVFLVNTEKSSFPNVFKLVGL